MSELLALGAVALIAGSASRMSYPVRSLEVFASAAYVSRTRFPEVGADLAEARDLVQGVKLGEASAVERGALLLSRHPDLAGFQGVVVPVPRSTPCRVVLNPLACALARLGVGQRVIPALIRIAAVPSSRMLRRLGRGGVTSSRHYRSMRLAADAVPPDAPVLLVDDVVTDGNTLLASANRLRNAGHRGPIFGAAVGWASSGPEALEQPAFEPVVVGVRMRQRATVLPAGAPRPRSGSANKPTFVVRSQGAGLKLLKHPDIVANHAKALKVRRKHRRAVLVPCAGTKPFPQAPSHKHGYLPALAGLKADVYVVAEPLGVVPYAWSRRYPNDAYDFPPKYLKGAGHDLLASRIREWFEQVGKRYDEIVLALPKHHMGLVRKAVTGLELPLRDASISACRSKGKCPSTSFRATSGAYKTFLRGQASK